MNSSDKYKAVKAEITAIYHENKGRYGYRRITTELHKRNFLLNHKTVQRLMKELGLVCRVRRKKYRSYKGEVGKIAPNLLNRDFRAEKPNQKWVTDVTEFSLFGEKLYLSPILGWQYRHRQYQRMLREKGIRQSMSRKGNCLDNSVMENFFGLLKQEIYYGVVYYSYEELKSEIERFIKYYNEKRIKEKLGWMSPVQYRLHLLAA